MATSPNPWEVGNRRTEASSSVTGDAGKFQISNVKYRVSAPPARPRPVINRWNEDCNLIRKVLGHALEDGVAKILSASDVQPSEAPELCFRCVERNASEGQPTILTVAAWDESSPPVWERVVTEAKQFVDATALASGQLGHLDVAVEMIADELWLPKYMSVIPNEELTPSLAHAWDDIRDKVWHTLDAYPQTKGRVTSISLFRLGFSEHMDSNPLTVYVSVDYESEEARWPPVADEIQRYLDTSPYNLRVHIEHDSSEWYPKYELLVKNLTPGQIKERHEHAYKFNQRHTMTVDLGDDIGAAGHLTASDGGKFMPCVGTLGCWVEIRTVSKRTWTRYALTTYHNIRPALAGFQISVDSVGATPATPVKDSDLWKADVNGIYPSSHFANPIKEVEHPTRAQHWFAVGIYNREIARNPPPFRDKAKEELARITAFFDEGNQRLGTIFAASGLGRRSPSRGRMDWALIKPLSSPPRIGKNTLPTLDEWTATDSTSWPADAVCGSSLRHPSREEGLRSTPNGAAVFKLGSASGPTSGVFSELKAGVAFRDDARLGAVLGQEKRSEFMYVEDPALRWFSKRGDAGSVVFDEEGRALGLLLGGHRPQQAANQCIYVTSIEDVFEDIKQFSKGGIIDIRIAED
ncbi:hypothetical protein NEMBOFW57_005955 [Staphylotrichum longicolle]|uniref:Uncharacterized protein n=1 Tax=Staphylotrichum longicolle TaxID=669026 RepID=A0AAD4EYH5_9PEZI|nr:hypothetical protein NEMBOFW57_005955 [Staphylotrichum longicolle]